MASPSRSPVLGQSQPRVKMCPPRNIKFSGRNNILEEMRKHLQESRSTEPAVVVLHGLPDVGKSQIAVQYVHQERDVYRVILFFGADSRPLLAEGFCCASVRLGLNTRPREFLGDKVAVLQKLKCLEVLWLVVFDGVNDPSVLSGAWPSVFSPEEGDECPLTQLHICPGNVKHNLGAFKLSWKAGGLPLEVVLMASWMCHRSLELEDFASSFGTRDITKEARAVRNSPENDNTTSI
ncbi:hypothetical protein B0H66DRAFT_596159 [Apodospora peruviana]|uniref:NB-ARC domain-containing protein n=1 Tax=Apodospora peruviana TaxID=516989 RepID=A0AAE0LY42_9PEZI|nr:hypothetical protein B0H66DRAFT_596159 [Apodospora peruviana]